MHASQGRLMIFVALVIVLFVSFVLYQRDALQGMSDSVKKFVVNRQIVTYGKESVGPVQKAVPFIPKDDVLKNMSMKDLLNITHRYMDHIEYLCRDQKRIGSVFDGGKHVCVDDYIWAAKPCLVYSFGSNNEFSFETDSVKWLGCEVHTFDPFVHPTNVPKGCTWHNFGLAETNKVEKNKTFYTLDKVMEELKHTGRLIDLLKIDIEGSEWASLNQMLKDNFLGKHVKQIVIELHINQHNNPDYIRDALAILRRLFDEGFLLFSRERNTFCSQCTTFKKELDLPLTFVTEFCYINTRFI